MATQARQEAKGFSISEHEKLFIGGAWESPRENGFIDVVSPSDGSKAARVAAP